MIVNISDDFDLLKIKNSGQCFRVAFLNDAVFRFITGKSVLYICKVSNNQYEVSCSKTEWDTVWTPFFDLSADYSAVRIMAINQGSFLSRAAEYGQGIRILRQDPWETLISFIISQRKNIPAIKRSIEGLSEDFGETITTPFETINLFPSSDQFKDDVEIRLLHNGLGYRTPYVMDAIAKVQSGVLNLEVLDSYSDVLLKEKLKTIHGVGDKVADCVSLFAYGRKSNAPIDIWIKRIISAEYGGTNPFLPFGDCAGIMQQYAFFYAQNHRMEVRNGQ